MTEEIGMMQQPKVIGYRQLNSEEAELMNAVKKLGQNIEGHVAMVESYLRTQRAEAVDPAEVARIEKASPLRWSAIARTDFQVALMALTRAIAQPSSF